MTKLYGQKLKFQGKQSHGEEKEDEMEEVNKVKNK